MQQLQLLQQRYLLQQAGMGQPGAPAGQSPAQGVIGSRGGSLAYGDGMARMQCFNRDM